MIAIFPWERGEKPYWVNPENGYEWYVDLDTTDYCKTEKVNWPKLNAVCFYVCKRDGEKVDPITRVLIERGSNKVLLEETNLENMACKIDIIRMLRKEENK